MCDQWGKRFIVLPNAMYGTWESAIYDYARLTDAQKAEKTCLSSRIAVKWKREENIKRKAPQSNAWK